MLRYKYNKSVHSRPLAPKPLLSPSTERKNTVGLSPLPRLPLSSPAHTVEDQRTTHGAEEEEKGDVLSFVRLSTRRKLAQLVTDHLGDDVHGHVLLTVVYEEAHPAQYDPKVFISSRFEREGKGCEETDGPDEVGKDGARPSRGLDRLVVLESLSDAGEGGEEGTWERGGEVSGYDTGEGR